MIELFLIMLVVLLVLGLLALAAVAGYTALALIAGAGFGSWVAAFICIKISDKRQEREDARRATDLQMMMELIKAAQVPQARQTPENLTIEQYTRTLPRVGKR